MKWKLKLLVSRGSEQLNKTASLKYEWYKIENDRAFIKKYFRDARAADSKWWVNLKVERNYWNEGKRYQIENIGEL